MYKQKDAMAAMAQKSWQIHNAAKSAQYYFIPCARAPCAAQYGSCGSHMEERRLLILFTRTRDKLLRSFCMSKI